MLGGEKMRTKMISGMLLLLVVTITLNVGVVMAKPQKAEEKNPNLSYVTNDFGTWLIMENGDGPKRGWCIEGLSEGQSVVYRDTSKLRPKTVDKLLSSGKWVPSGIFEGYIYKMVQYVDVS